MTERVGVEYRHCCWSGDFIEIENEAGFLITLELRRYEDSEKMKLEILRIWVVRCLQARCGQSCADMRY